MRILSLDPPDRRHLSACKKIRRYCKIMAWMADKVCFQQAAVDVLAQDPVHWSKETTSREDQGNANRDLHRRMAASSLASHWT